MHDHVVEEFRLFVLENGKSRILLHHGLVFAVGMDANERRCSTANALVSWLESVLLMELFRCDGSVLELLAVNDLVTHDPISLSWLLLPSLSSEVQT